MRVRRTIPTALLAALLASAIAVAPASADSGIDGGSSTATPATDASSTTKPVTDTTTKPVTETTTRPVTETTTTTSSPTTSSSTSTTSTSAPCTASSSSSDGPACLEGPTPVPNTPTEPKTPDVVPDSDGPIERPGGGELPFTGPGDVLLAVLLALLAGTGGILLLAGAAGREQIESLSRRSMGSHSGFHVQYREVLRDLTD